MLSGESERRMVMAGLGVKRRPWRRYHGVVLRVTVACSLRNINLLCRLRCCGTDEELDGAWIKEKRSGVNQGRYIPCYLTFHCHSSMRLAQNTSASRLPAPVILA